MTSDELRSRNMVNEAIADVASNIIKLPQKTPEQICLDRADERRHKAAVRFAAHLKARLTRPSYNEVVEELYPILRAEFSDWSRDDFATLACMVMAINAAETLRANSII